MGFGSLCITSMMTCMLRAFSYNLRLYDACKYGFLKIDAREYWLDYVSLRQIIIHTLSTSQMRGPVSRPSTRKSSKDVNDLLHTLRCGSTLPRKHLLVADRPTEANISGARSMLNVLPDMERMHFPHQNYPDDHYRTLTYMVCSSIDCHPGLSMLM